jgi:hypothetical protein
VATVALVLGVAGAGVGLFTPAARYYVPATFGVAVIVLAVMGFHAKARAWIALLLGAVALAEAVYGIAQVSHAKQAFVGDPSVATSGDSSIVNLPLGTTYNGSPLSVGLSRPVAYTPSASAVTTERTGRAVTFNIALTNRDTVQAYPLMSLNVQATSGTTQDTDIEDSAKNVGSSEADVLPGKSLVWQIAFSVPKDATDITVQVSSMSGGKTLVFTGSL